jgi:hypothetical protein
VFVPARIDKDVDPLRRFFEAPNDEIDRLERVDEDLDATAVVTPKRRLP